MKNSKPRVGFSLRSISTEQFAVIESAYSESSTVRLTVGLDFGVDESSEVVSCVAKIEFKTEKGSFIVLHVRCDFSVKEDAWKEFSCVEDHTICLPKGFASHLAVLTIGTARGVLHAKTENKKFNNFTLPTIDVTEIIKEDVRMELNTSDTSL
jgi:hypothetical protein